MWQAEESQIRFVEFRTGDELQVSSLSEVRMDSMNEFPGIGFRRRLDEVDCGMSQQQAQRLPPCIPGSSDYGNADHSIMKPQFPT